MLGWYSSAEFFCIESRKSFHYTENFFQKLQKFSVGTSESSTHFLHLFLKILRFLTFSCRK